MRSEASKNETRGHMFLVALIPRYKKNTHERKKESCHLRKRTEKRKRKKKEN